MSLSIGLKNKIRRSRAGGFTGLLDQPFATGATAAYSLRLLREKHSGGLVRVRADDSGTDKGEADVLPLLQPDGSKIITLNSPIENFSGTPFSGDGYVLADLIDAGNGNYDGLTSSWYDQTPNLNDASNSTASAQPQIVSGGTVIQENGKPTVQFNGNSQNVLNLPSGFALNSSAISAFTVAKETGSSNINGLFSNNSTLINDRWNINIVGEQPRIVVSYDGTEAEKIISSGFSRNTNFLISSITTLDGSTFNGAIKVNGNIFSSQLSSSKNDFSYLGQNWAIGTTAGDPNRYLIGLFPELIIYNFEQSSNRTNIETNINNHYSIF